MLRPRFKLRTILILTLFICFAAAKIRQAMIEFESERSAIELLQHNRIGVVTKTERRLWLPSRLVPEQFGRLFDRVVFLSVAHRKPDFESGVYSDPQRFKDEHIDLLAQFKFLSTLDVSKTGISETGVRKLARLSKLRAVKATDRDVARPLSWNAFQDARPDCLVVKSFGVQVHACNETEIFVNGSVVPVREAGKLMTKAAEGASAFGGDASLRISHERMTSSAFSKMTDTLMASARKIGIRHVTVFGADDVVQTDLNTGKIFRYPR